jgi:hypothetical protein
VHEEGTRVPKSFIVCPSGPSLVDNSPMALVRRSEKRSCEIGTTRFRSNHISQVNLICGLAGVKRGLHFRDDRSGPNGRVVTVLVLVRSSFTTDQPGVH